MSDFEKQMKKMSRGHGFIAALDQSGGSTPGALEAYGIGRGGYASGPEMHDLVHEMRTRIITNPAFDGDRIIGAILFETTMDRTIGDMPTARYLWDQKQIVPFLKVDQGMEAERDGVQLMKDIRGLDTLLERAREAGIFGTKMRSFIARAEGQGIGELVDQQFQFAGRILAAGLVPIIEPEVSIHAEDKAAAEELLQEQLLEHLDTLDEDSRVILKLTLPNSPGFYDPCRMHPRVVRIVALSGGYRRDEATELLAKNRGIVASFSRALAEGLSAGQSEAEFTATLDRSIAAIHAASIT